MQTSKRLLSLFICILLAISSIFQFQPIKAQAANKTLTLKKAYGYAVANSEEIEKIDYDILTQTAKKASAIKSLALKAKNRATLRWSPLLSFKWPTKPDMMDSYDETYKPLEIQNKINVLNHSLGDKKLEIYEKVNNLFVSIITCEEKIDFEQQRIKSIENDLKVNRKRKAEGNADAKDITAMEKKIESLKKQVAENTRTMTNDKKKLSELVGFDVTVGYTFENPYLKGEIPRSALNSIKEYTLANSQTYYEACQKTALSKTSLDTFWGLISSRYSSSYVNIIRPYVTSAINGQKVNATAFKKAYDQFLIGVDEKWAGDYVIWLLFFKIRFAKERLKGDLDGARYMEDDPYALYEAAMEYQTNRVEKANIEKEILDQIDSTFETYVGLKNTYESNVQIVNKAKEELKREEVLNRIGELTYDEFKSTQDSYDEDEMNLITSLADYSKNLYSFDRLTCGAVSKYLTGESQDLVAIGNGVSHVVEDTVDGATYYMEPIISQNMFELSISIPDDSDVTVTDYALFCDNIQIGAKTPFDKTLRHLALTKESIDEAKIRLFDGDKVVCDCVIEPESYSGPLNIVKGYTIETDPIKIIATSFSCQAMSDISMTQLKLEISDDYDDIKYFKLFTKDGKELGYKGSTATPIEGSFKYPGLVTSSLEELTIKFYADKDGDALYEGYFDTVNMKVIRSNE